MLDTTNLKHALEALRNLMTALAYQDVNDIVREMQDEAALQDILSGNFQEYDDVLDYCVDLCAEMQQQFEQAHEAARLRRR